MKLIKFIDDATEKVTMIYVEDIKKYREENEFSVRVILDLHDENMSYLLPCGMDELLDLINVPSTDEDFQVIDLTSSATPNYTDEDIENMEG
ncbi:MAG: hypothetical protein JST75_20160 [Bacteroidetes bacterium]|nr:hypothetical protein [Bacteroidota bacterium]